jgi:hypothetical protein
MRTASAPKVPRLAALAGLAGLAALAGLALAAVSCSDATGVVRGGEPLVAPGPADPCVDGGTSSTWTDLYTCFFGPTGRASCSSQGTCHGDPSQTGALSSGFVCGTSKDECFKGMSDGTYCSVNTIPPCPIVPANGTSSFASTGLYRNLAKVGGGGNMPQNGSYLFTKADLARIAQWITDGAKND